MEKKEAVREWCIDIALSALSRTALADNAAIDSEEVIEYAKELEKYITK